MSLTSCSAPVHRISVDSHTHIQHAQGFVLLGSVNEAPHSLILDLSCWICVYHSGDNLLEAVELNLAGVAVGLICSDAGDTGNDDAWTIPPLKFQSELVPVKSVAQFHDILQVMASSWSCIKFNHVYCLGFYPCELRISSEDQKKIPTKLPKVLEKVAQLVGSKG